MREGQGAGPFISVVVPAFDELANLPALVERLKAVLEGLGTWEIIVCDDGSSDGSLELLRSYHAADPRLRYCSFSRNFGHQNALRAGLERARGEVTVSLDADLQHPPELIPRLVEKYREGFDVVVTLRRAEADLPVFKRFGSRAFYRLMNLLGDLRIQEGTADFRLLSRRALQALCSFPEHGVFWRGVVPWIGFRQCAVEYEPAPRLHGGSKYSAGRMFRFALDGITSFSVRPLQLTTMAGVLSSGFAFVYAVYALVMRLFSDRTVAGWTSILISVLFIGGIQLISLGILGAYLGKLFIEAKGRPHYIVAEESE